MEYVIRIAEQQPDPFAKLPALAKRLGVDPTNKASVSVRLIMQDGTAYDVFDLVNAALDRLDAAARS